MSDLLSKFCKLNIECKSSPKIAVVGDAMIDEYFDVKVKKISPEFPIPVMHSESEESNSFPGGAANVVYQINNFKSVEGFLVGFVDNYAEKVFFDKSVNTKFCLKIENLIPRKRRFYSNDFPTYRWDIEKENYGLGSNLESNCKLLKDKANQKFDVIIFSDYDKGVLKHHLYELINNCPISIVDPKSGPLSRYKNCTIFKPNASEALALTGCKNIEDAGKKLLCELNCQSVIITQAGDGISIFYKELGEILCREIRPKIKLPTAESVIGAGDCFVAFLAMSLSLGFNVLESAEIAWEAGVIYVRNKYNQPLHPNDLSTSKIVDPQFLSKRNFKLVFTNGCFDILHAGHLESLRFAKSMGEKLVVAVNTDESVAENKPGRPFVKLKDRMNLLAGLEFVDYVVSFSEKTPLEVLKIIRPDVLVKGAEYSKENIVGNDLVSEVVVCPMVDGLSTTNLINSIKSS
jgi:D-beta-D-heptose 7-phosphate kinase/D-beta-D-heptose 1-phosphate adenosyltransferase